VNKVLVQDWLEKLANAASKGNVDEHMELISENINVLDEPGQRNLDYEGLAEYCRSRFQDNAPLRVSYQDMHIKTMTPARVKFIATETVEQPDCVDQRGLEFIIQREDDGRWRAVQERLLTADDSNPTRQ